MLRLLLQELGSRRGAIIGWGLGLCFFPVVYVGMYPSFAEQLVGYEELMDWAIFQAMGISWVTFDGYVASSVTNLIPIILAVYAVIDGTGTLAGEEDNGRLELIVSLPIPRWQIVAVKAVALGVALVLILAITATGAALTFVAIRSQVETNLTAVDLFLSLLASWPLVMVFGMISLFLGVFCPSRRIAGMIATVVIVASYLGSNLTGTISSLEPLRNLFVFHFFETTAETLENGQQAGNVLVLLAIALVAFGLAVLFFQIRDITVGAWPWQRGRIPEAAKE